MHRVLLCAQKSLALQDSNDLPPVTFVVFAYGGTPAEDRARPLTGRFQIGKQLVDFVSRLVVGRRVVRAGPDADARILWGGFTDDPVMVRLACAFMAAGGIEREKMLEIVRDSGYERLIRDFMMGLERKTSNDLVEAVQEQMGIEYGAFHPASR